MSIRKAKAPNRRPNESHPKETDLHPKGKGTQPNESQMPSETMIQQQTGKAIALAPKDLRAGYLSQWMDMSYHRITKEESDEIVRLWLYEHKSYQQIHETTGRTLDTISGIINDFKQTQPDIDRVREVIAEITASGKTIPDVLRTLNILDYLENNGVTSEQILECMNLLLRHGDRAPAVLDAGVRIDALEREKGLPYSEIERRYRDWDQTRLSIAADEAHKTELETEIQELEDLKQIKTEMNTNQISVAELSSFIGFHKERKELNFTERAARVLGTELANTGLTAEEGSRKIADMIQEYGNTKNAIETTKTELRDIENLKASLLNEQNSLLHQIEDLKSKLDLATTEFSKKRTIQDKELIAKEADKQRLEKEIFELEETRQKKETEFALADSMMTLVTNPKGLTPAQLDTLITRLHQAKDNRERALHHLAEDQLESAVSVVGGYLITRAQDKLMETERSRYSLVQSRNEDQVEMQRLTMELKKEDQVIEKINEFFTGKSSPSPFMRQPGYECPLCNAPILLSTKNTHGSINVKCGNCQKSSKPSLLELYQNVLKNEEA